MGALRTPRALRGRVAELGACRCWAVTDVLPQSVWCSSPSRRTVSARLDEKHEWAYSQEKHRKALRTAKGLVDQSVPKSINPQAQNVQAATRRFCEDKRHAEIGRENQKLVNRLSDIAKGDRPADPRGPPPRTAPSSAPATVAAFALQARKRPSA